MNGLVGGAMSGLGEGLMLAGKQYGEYSARSALQEEAAKIQALRDERLAELRKQELGHAEDLRRETDKQKEDRAVAPKKRAAEAIEKGKSEFVDDPSGTVRPRTRPEMAEVEEGAYRKEGLIDEAMRVRTEERQRDTANLQALDRNKDNEARDRYHDILEKHYAAGDRARQTSADASGRRADRPAGGAGANANRDLTDSQKVMVTDFRSQITALRREKAEEYDPARKRELDTEIADLQSKIDGILQGDGTPGSGTPKPRSRFGSADEVRKALREGKIDREAALRELRTHFGMK